MSFQEVLDLTPFQIAALLAEKSLPPGELDPDKYRKVIIDASEHTMVD